MDRHRAGRLEEASALYEKILQTTPDHVDALYLLGVIAHQNGQPDRAIEFMGRSLAVVPDQARCYNILGLNLKALGQADQAELSFRRAISLDNSAEHHNNLGVLFREQERLDEAMAAYQQALARDARHAATHYNLGNVYRAKSEFGAAAESYRRAIEGDPAHWRAHCDLGDVLQTLGQFEAASAAYRRSLELNPAQPGAWYAAGCAESARKDYVIAAACFRKTLELQPDWPEAQHNLGQVFFKIGQIEEALGLFRQASAAADPALPLAAIAVAIPGSPSSDNQAILDARRLWAERYLPAPRPSRPVRTAGPLRIGYVSAFLQDHNWMKPVWGLINHHDRQHFEIHLLSDAPRSQIQHGYRDHSQDHFHDTTTLSNQSLAELIEQSEIDLLVDLNGYSTLPRLPLFAMKPAPIIAGWFNMYATTGIPAYDYLIGDDQVIPPDEEKFYTEKIARVPGSYLTFEVTYPVPDVADPPCLSTGAITFGCLASQYKITSQVIDAWARILEQAPGSSLILKNAALGPASVRQFVHDQFARHHISPDRIRLHGPSNHFQFLETYGKIDIALDTFPYNGGTTTTEAIWQGVPVVTFHGDRWVSRTSASILLAATLGELVAPCLDDYIALAVRLANSPDYLLDLRRNMRTRLLASSVCDTQAFAQNMERLYTQMR